MSQRQRSPILGYNHNLRHGGRVFHVQTEDSGLAYARLYTHLFYQGTILSSKKEQYDPVASEDVVRAAMQKLHKMMIMELTHAEHDVRIAAFFLARGEPATLPDPPSAVAAEVAAPVAAPVAVTAPLPAAAPVPAAPAPGTVAPAPVTVAPAPVTAAPAPVTAAPAPVERPKVTPKPVVVVQPQPAARRPSVVLSGAADGVVVRRNVVIDVGAGQPPVQGTTGGKPTPPGAAWPATRTRAGAHYAVRDGSNYVAGNRSRAAVPESQPQPLASARDIRMPWETPAPVRIAPVTQTAAQSVGVADGGSTVNASGKIRMPWDAAAAGAPEAFASELVSDKSLDEVILEYLADDGEPD